LATFVFILHFSLAETTHYIDVLPPLCEFILTAVALTLTCSIVATFLESA